MAYPVYEDNGGLATGTDATVAVNYPATVNDGDILIANLLDADNDTFSAPGGWTEIYQEGADSNACVAYFWYRADGTETGSVTFTSAAGSGQLIVGVISRYSGVHWNTPPESGTGTAVSQGNAVIPAITTSRSDDMLAVGLVGLEDDTGISGASNYTQSYLLGTTVGSDGQLGGYHQQVNSSPSSESLNVNSKDYAGTGAILLIGGVQTPLSYPKPLKYYNGSSWVEKPLKYYNGSWTTKSLKTFM